MEIFKITLGKQFNKKMKDLDLNKLNIICSFNPPYNFSIEFDKKLNKFVLFYQQK